VDAISFSNIDTISEWRVENKRPIMEAAPDYLEESQKQQGTREDDPELLGGDEEETKSDEVDVQTSTQKETPLVATQLQP